MRITNLVTVAPKIKGAVYTIENNSGRATFAPVPGQIKGPGIAADWVIFGHDRRGAGESVFHIGVNRIIVTLSLPVAGYCNVLFCARIRVLPRRRYVFGSIKQVKLPLAIQVDS